MQPEDVYELVNAGDPRISPDGTRVAYVVTVGRPGVERVPRRDLGRARSTAPASRGSSPPGSAATRSPRWSPDGNWLAFASNRGDDKTPMNLYVIPAEGGEARKLTDLKESVEEIVWSPDSTRIAFTARVRDEAYDGRGREEARAAPVHARLPQARQRRLHRRPPQAHLRRRPRRRRAEAADERRLRARRPRVVARRQAHRHRRPARRALGRRADQPPLRGRRRRRRRAEGADGRRRLVRDPSFSPDGTPHRVPLDAGGRHVSASHASSA